MLLSSSKNKELPLIRTTLEQIGSYVDVTFFILRNLLYGSQLGRYMSGSSVEASSGVICLGIQYGRQLGRFPKARIAKMTCSSYIDVTFYGSYQR